MSNFMTVCAVGAELFQTDRQIDITKLIVGFCSIANLLQNLIVISVAFFWVSHVYVGLLVVDRLNSWIKAHSHLHNREYSQAVTTFRQLDERSSLRDNLSLLVAMGESHYYSGDHKNALIVLQRVSIVVPPKCIGKCVHCKYLTCYPLQLNLSAEDAVKC
jgi:hypothetical protein